MSHLPYTKHHAKCSKYIISFNPLDHTQVGNEELEAVRDYITMTIRILLNCVQVHSISKYLSSTYYQAMF